ncbi:hypothetical protein [Sphingomonas sp. LM7]|uniref:hypothetical protein n=1 Tax=Sphingomonas sp. LM7 TaxID=1938607 RepID=UPI000983B340|nr:hypothetical protein [Sphingomonas sp. LM7]AQR73105.1 hypothetical protein BXU08_04915 [Sphingomonas sp. LM7]
MYIIVLTLAVIRTHFPAIAALPLLAIPAVVEAQPSDYPVACFYSDRSGMLEHAEACATDASEQPRLAPAVVARLGYDHGLAQLSIAQAGWFYRHRNGRMARMLTFDNGPDPFSWGLARGRIGGHLAYVDRQLRVRIRTAYDWGEPFERGRAEVCIGCSLMPVDGGEHHVVTGGRWGIIDCRGIELVPVRYPSAELHAVPAKAPSRGCKR